MGLNRSLQGHDSRFLEKPPSMPPVEPLDALFAGLPDGADASSEDRARVDRIAGPGAATFGRVTDPGGLRLFRWLRLQPNEGFVDVGSGTGRLVIQGCILAPEARFLGVELSKERHAVASIALERMRGQWSPNSPYPQVSFRCDDFRNVDLSPFAVVWAGSLAFPRDLLAALAVQARNLPRLRALLSLRPIPEVGLRERGRFPIATTWSDSAPVWVYEPARPGA